MRAQGTCDGGALTDHLRRRRLTAPAERIRLVDGNKLLTIYSLNKEDIEVAIVDTREID